MTTALRDLTRQVMLANQRNTTFLDGETETEEVLILKQLSWKIRISYFQENSTEVLPRKSNLESSTCGKEKTQEATGMLQARENEEKDKKLQA